jgi:hypothetical protein
LQDIKGNIVKKILIALMLTLSLNAFTIEDDKVKHMVAGTLVYGGCIVIGEFTDLGLDPKNCLLPVFAVAAGKEVYDANYGGTSDFNDFTATMFIPFGTYTIYSW